LENFPSLRLITLEFLTSPSQEAKNSKKHTILTYACPPLADL
jgi:hypothetical protein